MSTPFDERKNKNIKFISDGTVVDPDSGLVDLTNVLVEGGTKYFAILNLTDIQENKNSYCKLQLLESNNKLK